MHRNVAALVASAVLMCGAGRASRKTLKAVKDRGMLDLRRQRHARRALACRTRRATGPASTSTSAARLRRRCLNDPNKVKFVPLSAKDRFTALQSGEVDVLARNTTWTSSRDTSLGLNFTGVNYYDGQGFMVRKSAEGEFGARAQRRLDLRPAGHHDRAQPRRLFPRAQYAAQDGDLRDRNEAVKAYDAGRCDAYTTDASGLYGARLRLANSGRSHRSARDHLQGAARSVGASRRRPVVRYREVGSLRYDQCRRARASRKKNVDEMLKSTNPTSKRLLGTEGNYGEQLGLTKDWAVSHHQGRRQLRRDVRAQRRAGLAAQDRSAA